MNAIKETQWLQVYSWNFCHEEGRSLHFTTLPLYTKLTGSVCQKKQSLFPTTISHHNAQCTISGNSTLIVCVMREMTSPVFVLAYWCI